MQYIVKACIISQNFQIEKNISLLFDKFNRTKSGNEVDKSCRLQAVAKML